MTREGVAGRFNVSPFHRLAVWCVSTISLLSGVGPGDKKTESTSTLYIPGFAMFAQQALPDVRPCSSGRLRGLSRAGGAVGASREAAGYLCERRRLPIPSGSTACALSRVVDSLFRIPVASGFLFALLPL